MAAHATPVFSQHSMKSHLNRPPQRPIHTDNNTQQIPFTSVRSQPVDHNSNQFILVISFHHSDKSFLPTGRLRWEELAFQPQTKGGQQKVRLHCKSNWTENETQLWQLWWHHYLKRQKCVTMTPGVMAAHDTTTPKTRLIRLPLSLRRIIWMLPLIIASTSR